MVHRKLALNPIWPGVEGVQLNILSCSLRFLKRHSLASVWQAYFLPDMLFRVLEMCTCRAHSLTRSSVFPVRYKVRLMLLSCPLQLRSIPVKGAEDDELEEEADWIYRNAFATPTISLQVPKKKRSLCTCTCVCVCVIFMYIFHIHIEIYI